MYHIYTHCMFYISIYDYREGSLVVNYTIEVMYHIYTHCIHYISIHDYREGSLIVNYTIEVDVSHIHTLYSLHKYI